MGTVACARRAVGLLLTIGALVSCSTIPNSFQLTPEKVLVHQPSGTEFLQSVAGFSRTQPVSYNEPGTDVSVNYQVLEPALCSLDMYVFPASNVAGPIGILNQHGDWVRTIMAEHRGAVAESDARVEVTAGGGTREAEHAVFSYTDVLAGLSRKVSSVLIEFEEKGWFVSYRMTTPFSDRDAARELLVEFIRQAPLPSRQYTPVVAGFAALVRDATPQSVQAALDAGGISPLMRAAASNPDAQVIAVLLKAGARLEARSTGQETALMYAAGTNANPAVAGALLEAGADPAARSKTGMTALICAAGYNPNPAVIGLLLAAGADIGARTSSGGTVLTNAVWRNQSPQSIQALLAAGADVNAVDNNGHTALMWASVYSLRPEVLTLLLAAGADASVKDKTGKTALDFALHNPRLRGTDALRELQAATQ